MRLFSLRSYVSSKLNLGENMYVGHMRYQYTRFFSFSHFLISSDHFKNINEAPMNSLLYFECATIVYEGLKFFEKVMVKTCFFVVAYLILRI